jgi:CheY-like chemotaxis protein
MKWKGKVILIVEDDEVSLEFLREVFIPTEVEVLISINGEEAIEIAKANDTIDLVLMDVQLPTLSGIDATREIKKLHPQVPVIAQTAFAMTGDKEKYLAMGFDDYLAKPINMNELLKITDYFLDD